MTYNTQDHVGSIVARTDSSGNILSKYKYAPFGESPSLTGTIFGFTGQRFDAETGLYHFKARYYDPVTGRFLQPDPIGYGDGLNLYRYARNSPHRYNDPSGNESDEVKEGSEGIDDFSQTLQTVSEISDYAAMTVELVVAHAPGRGTVRVLSKRGLKGFAKNAMESLSQQLIKGESKTLKKSISKDPTRGRSGSKKSREKANTKYEEDKRTGRKKGDP